MIYYEHCVSGIVLGMHLRIIYEFLASVFQYIKNNNNNKIEIDSFVPRQKNTRKCE